MTACNCSFCSRAGALWIYGHADNDVTLTAAKGALLAYVQGDRTLAFLSCRTCGNLLAWRGLQPGEDGRIRCAVNMRLTDPGPVADLPIIHFNGRDSFRRLPRDGRCVRDMWF